MCALWCQLPVPSTATEQASLRQPVHFPVSGRMITINSHYVSSPEESKHGQVEHSRLKFHKQTIFYKIACLCYLLVIILLLTFFIVRAFKSKYRLDTECYSSNWIDTVITVLTLTAILLASLLLIASFKYVSQYENPLLPEQPVIAVDKTEDFIRRNSQQHPQPPVDINRTSSIGSSSWLSAVRNEAYESHRRMSMAPVPAHTKSQSEDNAKVSLTVTGP